MLRLLFQSLKLLVILVMALAIVAGARQFAAALAPPPPAPVRVTVTVHPGDGPAEISRRLEAQGLIRSGATFRTLLRVRNAEGKLTPGSYPLIQGMSMNQIIDVLTAPPLGLTPAPTVALTPLVSPTATPPPATATPRPTTGTPSPVPQVQPSATATPPVGQWVAVANTGGDGIYLRRTPRLADRLIGWPDGTKLQVVGPDAQGDGQPWKQVRDPQGNVGWVPAQYVTPTSPPTP